MRARRSRSCRGWGLTVARRRRILVAGILVAVSSGEGWLFLLTASSGTMLGYAAMIYAVFLYHMVNDRWLGLGERAEAIAGWLVLLLVGFPIALLVTVPVLAGHGLTVLWAASILTPPALYIVWKAWSALVWFFTEGS